MSQQLPQRLSSFDHGNWSSSLGSRPKPVPSGQGPAGPCGLGPVPSGHGLLPTVGSAAVHRAA